jgi:site-specific DNA-methyltransferase (adenine-specific)
MLARRPRPPARLTPDAVRDAKIIQAFAETHKGYALDRVLADPDLARRFVEKAHELGVDALPALINRRILRIRKAKELDVETTVKEKRDLGPFLIPAELAFAKLSYQYDASYDDLLADPEIGAAFDALALKFGGAANVVDYRLAALHLRKNVRSRQSKERQELANLGISDLNKRWRPVGAFATISLNDVPAAEGIFALSEPNRYLYLTRYPNMREGVQRFRDQNLLGALANKFWTPSLDSISVQLIRQQEAKGITLRLLELKALEVYRPIFNLLPAA